MSKTKKEEKFSEEAYAYTPGLKIKEIITIDKERKLPIQGKVLVEEGQEVSFDAVVAETALEAGAIDSSSRFFRDISPNRVVRG